MVSCVNECITDYMRELRMIERKWFYEQTYEGEKEKGLRMDYSDRFDIENNEINSENFVFMFLRILTSVLSLN